MANIKVLSEKVINMIAAGEVVQYPYNILKELVENSLDALESVTDRHKKISIALKQAGKTLISVSDNGIGIPKEDLCYALLRHATSKIRDESLDNISTLGFRGEGLAAIASVAKVLVTSRTEEALHAWEIYSEEAPEAPWAIENVRPAARNEGTTVEVRDLFHNQSNRLRFLRSDTTESVNCLSLIQSLAIAYPEVSWHLTSNDRVLINYPTISDCHIPSLHQPEADISKLQPRLDKILGEDFVANSIPISYTNEQFAIHGYITTPTFSRSKSSKLFCFVNRRVVKDQLLYSAIRIGYGTSIPRENHPTVVLFISMLPHMVNVNIHPNKTEVKFSNENDLKSILIHIIRTSLAKARPSQHFGELLVRDVTRELRASSIGTPGSDSAGLIQQRSASANSLDSLTDRFSQLPMESHFRQPWFQGLDAAALSPSTKGNTGDEERSWLQGLEEVAFTPSSNEGNLPQKEHSTPSDWINDNRSARPESVSESISFEATNPGTKDSYYLGLSKSGNKFRETSLFTEDNTLGQPLCQLALRYIIAVTPDSLVIVDQHAAHERLVLQRLFEEFRQRPITSQVLLLAQTYDLGLECNTLLYSIRDELSKIGYHIDKDEQDRLIITQIPLIFGGLEHEEFLKTIAAHVDEYRMINDETIERILGEIACHSSIRSGRAMNITEMNKMLRDIEVTDFAGQCNHGRPTYIKIALSYIDKLFERS